MPARLTTTGLALRSSRLADFGPSGGGIIFRGDSGLSLGQRVGSRLQGEEGHTSNDWHELLFVQSEERCLWRGPGSEDRPCRQGNLAARERTRRGIKAARRTEVAVRAVTVLPAQGDREVVEVRSQGRAEATERASIVGGGHLLARVESAVRCLRAVFRGACRWTKPTVIRLGESRLARGQGTSR